MSSSSSSQLLSCRNHRCYRRLPHLELLGSCCLVLSVCFCAIRARATEPQTLRLRSRTGRPFMHQVLENCHPYILPLPPRRCQASRPADQQKSFAALPPPHAVIGRVGFRFALPSGKVSLCFQHLYSSNIPVCLSTPFFELLPLENFGRLLEATYNIVDQFRTPCQAYSFPVGKSGTVKASFFVYPTNRTVFCLTKDYGCSCFAHVNAK